MNKSLILVTIPALISLGASIYGMYKLFQKKKPLYFQLLVCAAACFALEELYSTVGIWCNIYNSAINLGMIGVFGCNFFLLSANYGQLDSIVDDGNSINRKAKTIAWLGPIILGLAIIAIVMGFYDGFFGPGSGTFYVFAFLWVGYDYVRGSANGKMLTTAAMLSALPIFIYNGTFYWDYALFMFIGIIPGAVIGSRFVITHDVRYIRPMYLAVVAALIGKQVWSLFN